MDNRRVAKAYRDRSLRAKVLPYPAPSGLLSKVKRYFSGPASSHKPADESSQARYASERMHPAFPPSANTSLVSDVADQTDSNRILSSFFQEKGSNPLSQVEYEGVLSLMEKSRANNSMADTSVQPESRQSEPAPKQRRNSQYTQKVLRNSSMHDANNSSYVAPDYKPVYHTFSENSHNISRSSNVSMKRVYQFSGLPSPYRTRIKAPNTTARQTRRVSSRLPVEPVHEATANSTFESASTFKPKSKTANTLLSILDGSNPGEKPSDTTSSSARPLHNPYTKGKRLLPSHTLDAPAAKKPTTTADDIAKTVSYTKVEALSEQNGSSLFDNVSATSDTKVSSDTKAESDVVSGLQMEKDGKPANDTSTPTLAEKPKKLFDFGAQKSEEPKPALKFGSAVPSMASSSENKSSEPKPAFSFGKSTTETKSSEGSASLPSFNFGGSKGSDSAVSKPGFNFGTKSSGSSAGFTFGSKTEVSNNGIESNSSKNGEEAVTDAEKNVNGVNVGSTSAVPKLFSFGANPVVSSSEAQNPTSSTSINETSYSVPENAKPFSFGENKASNSKSMPTFNFQAKALEKSDAKESSTENKPSLNFGAKAPESQPSFTFGKTATKSESNGESSNEEKPGFKFGAKSEQPKPFLFGAKSETPNPSPFGADTEAAKPVGSDANSGTSQADSKPVSSFGAKPAFNIQTPSTSSNSFEAAKPAFNFGQSSDKKPAFNFGKAEANDKKTFGFGPVKTSESDNGSGGSLNGGGSANGSAEFSFPSVEVKQVNLDETKVKEYEKLFDFSQS